MATKTSKKPASTRNTSREVEREPGDDEEEAEAGEATPFDYSAFFKAAGLKYTDKELRDVSSILPIYSFEDAAEEEWPPLFGLVCNRVMIEVDKTAADLKQRIRAFYIVEAEIATHALAGTGDDRETVDIAPGQYVLMPESGALKNLNELKMAAVDPDFVHRALFRVTGRKIDLGKPGRNPMWEVEVKMIDDPVKRAGRYLLANTNRDDATKDQPQQLNSSVPQGLPLNAQGQPARMIG